MSNVKSWLVFNSMIGYLGSERGDIRNDLLGVIGGFIRRVLVLEGEDASGMRDELDPLYIAC